MNKLKTKKAITKRFKITKNQKMLRRLAGQDHFNAKQSGQKARQKHRTKTISAENNKTYRKILPFM